MKLIVQLRYILLGLICVVMCAHASISKNKQHIPFVPVHIRPLSVIRSMFPEISYQKVYEKYHYQHSAFVTPEYKTKGCFDELFVLDIPGAIFYGYHGHFFVNNNYIKEFVWADQKESIPYALRQEIAVSKISGRVAMLAQPCCDNYVHFIEEILGRLAILELAGVEYDYLYLPICDQFVLEFLNLWGVDLSKVICCENEKEFMQAEHLIVPSFVINTDLGFKQAGLCAHPVILKYVQERLLQAALDQASLEQASLEQADKKYPERIFLSRKDAPSRKILNEDELFAELEPYGFVRCQMSKLSVVEQILTCYHAKIVAAEHGAALINTLFCKPNTKVIELFQQLIDSGFWWACNVVKLDYHPILMLDVDMRHFIDVPKYPKEYAQAWKSATVVPVEPLRKYLQTFEW